MRRRAYTVTAPDGTTIALDDWGDGQLTLVLLHGAMMSRRAWADLIDALREQDGVASLRIIAIDLPGFGGSSMPDGLDYPAQSERLTAALDTLGVKRSGRPVIIVGHSMGGAIALNIALRRRDLVDGLVLLDTGLAQGKGAGSIAKLEVGTIAPQARRDLLSRYISNWLYEPKPEVVERLLDDALHVTHEAMVEVRKAVAQHDLRGQKTAFPQIPLLVMRGSHDRTRTQEEAEELCQLSTRATLAELRDSGHCPNVEKPVDTAQALIRWLAAADFLQPKARTQ